MTHVRVHTYVALANPYLRCDQCHKAVSQIHDPERCGCDGVHYNRPCGHTGTTSLCPSWGPVDGCRCEPTGPLPEGVPVDPYCPEHGSLPTAYSDCSCLRVRAARIREAGR